MQQARVAVTFGSLWLAVVACSATPAPIEPVTSYRSIGQLAAIEATIDLEGVVVGPSQARATIVVMFASWCSNCHHELAILARLRAQPNLRLVGVSYRGHEEYDGRGNAIALRRYVADHAPWLRVVIADDQLFTILDQPTKVPTLFVYDASGKLVVTYDRRERAMPDEQELRDLLQTLGA